jgi:ATP-dependent Clp protease ATP-binding subunit ClpC|tara:strand:+ start:3362 stop:5380 length:2019 start_codon:yes stop_codon:yes gene_type:complete
MSEIDEIPKEEPRQRSKDSTPKSSTPILDNFSRDLTMLASLDELDPVIGRKNEIRRIAQTLSRRKKNNPILIGEPGCGKTAIVEGLAMIIYEGKCPRNLLDKRIVSLELTSLVAGTKYRGQFEERMKAVLDELRDNDDIIIFIDEIHTVVGTGNSSGNLDAANIFKPALARGEVQCIGATTLDEYREKIEKDGALDRRFQKVHIEPTTPEETLQILKSIKDKYEDHHKVIYTDDTLKQCVSLAERYITEREFPDKAIDIMDEVGSKVQLDIKYPKTIEDLKKKIVDIKALKFEVVQSQKYEKAAEIRDTERTYVEELEHKKTVWEKKQELNRLEVSLDDVLSVVSDITKIPLSRLGTKDKKRLLNLEKNITSFVIGQTEAVEKVSKSIRRNSVGIRDSKKPIGSFIFLGPTGVGKTHLAKKLAEEVFGSEESVIRVDMSEFQEKHSMSRLIGSPPGYVGYNEGGQLTEKIRLNPYSLVLFDEIEKAHSDVFNLMLQILDDGYVTDASGRKVNFKNTLIIMTSNIGIRQVMDFGTGIGFSTKAKKQKADEHTRTIISKALKNTFNPEFLNRLDDIITFNSLDKKSLKKIVKLELESLKSRLLEKNYTFNFGPSIVSHIVEVGYDEKFGARPLQRAIQTEIEDFISDEILKGDISEHTNYILSYNKKTEKVKIK